LRLRKVGRHGAIAQRSWQSETGDTAAGGMATRLICGAWCLTLMLAHVGGLDLGARRAAFHVAAPHKHGSRAGGAPAAFAATDGATWIKRQAGVPSRCMCGHVARLAAGAPSRSSSRACGALMMRGDENAGDGPWARALDGFLDKVEAKSQKKYDKFCAKTDRLKQRAARLSNALASVRDEEARPAESASKLRKRDRIKRIWALATSSPLSVVVSLTILACALPGLTMLVGSVAGFVTFLVLLVQIFLITLAPAGMLVLAGGTLFLPTVMNAASLGLTMATLAMAVLVRMAPRTRNLGGLSLATILPLANLWLASRPLHSFEVVKSMRVFDPLGPMLTDPFFRPILPDLFISDFLDLVPNPFLMRGPTVFIESSSPAPFLALKAAVSIGALAVAAYYWYQEREAVREQLRRAAPLLGAAGASATASTSASAASLTRARDTEATRDLDTLRDAIAKEDLDRWEAEYKLRPEPSVSPGEWSVDDLAYVLETRGLGSCVDKLRKAGIDGRVALTLTSADEADIKQDLGIEMLGERRRLLLLFDEMREMQQQQQRPAAPPSPGAAQDA
jgi:hypothetical protein